MYKVLISDGRLVLILVYYHDLSSCARLLIVLLVYDCAIRCRIDHYIDDRKSSCMLLYILSFDTYSRRFALDCKQQYSRPLNFDPLCPFK